MGKQRREFQGGFTIGMVLLALIALMTAVSFFYLPYEYQAMDSRRRFQAPTPQHPLGTDNFGRDMLSRIMAGAKYTLLTACVTVAGSAALGSALGLGCAYLGGLAEELAMRCMDAVSAFPGILLALLTAALFENKEAALILALLILFIPSFARITRSGMLQYKQRDFVKIARLWGASHGRIIFFHILPNLKPSLGSAAVVGLSNAIVAESTMSYLGLGVQPPAPSWGRMLAESQQFFLAAPWCALAPGGMIMLCVLAFHYLGEGISGQGV
ncbi:MAG: ABC transporter permease [Treponema sp.]|jgi:peptide/nickel transport system permease protein|nr:ABC transporter permease [Treponema sp.]